MSNSYDICVIGGGAAGIMAAIYAAKKGSRVVLIEKNDILGRKILATGNGRCNLTNTGAASEYYNGASREFIDGVLSKFDANQTIQFFSSINVLTKEENKGRIFPRSNQAATVVDALKAELAFLKVEIVTSESIKSISKENELWLISGTKTFTSSCVIITTGGRAAHMFGSSGDGLFWLNNMGYKIESPRAALVAIELKSDFRDKLMGIKIDTKISLLKNGHLVKEKSGEAIFTHFGISGPAAMSLGRYIDSESTKYEMSVDLIPEYQTEELDQIILDAIRTNGTKSIKNIISGLLPEKIANVICDITNIQPTRKAAEISKKDREHIVNLLKNFKLEVSKVRPLKEAQVTAGGVMYEEVNPDTLESNKDSGLYLAGEILDVDGESGGYNLQWAWSSGYVAGTNASRKCNHE